MSRISEEITLESGLCTATIYLEFLGKKFKIAKKTTNDGFKNIDVEFFYNATEYFLDEDISGYTVYELISSVKDAVSDGNYHKLYSYVDKFNYLEEKARRDILEIKKAKEINDKDKFQRNKDIEGGR